MSKAKLWRGLATLTAVLLVISMGVSSMANSRVVFLNDRLKTSNYRIVVKETDEDVGDGIYFDSEFSTLEELINAQTDMAAELAGEGAVLLKNNGALPLNKGSEQVTLWGLNSDCPVLGGLVGSSPTINAEAGQTSIGLKEAMSEKGFQLNSTMLEFYSRENSAMDPYRMHAEFFGNAVPGHALTPVFWPSYENPSGYFVGEAPASLYGSDVLASADGSAAIVVISRDNSEATDYHPDMVNTTKGDSFERPFSLSKNERAVIDLAKAHSSKVIVLLNSDNPMEVEELKTDDGVGAILWVGAPGMYGFSGVADVLSGDVNPSGHLSDTYAVNSATAPAMVNWGVYTYTNSSVSGGELTEANKADWYLVESEGIYIGYKYYETRYEDQILGRGKASDAAGSSTGSDWSYSREVSYPFGYGLSYTTFEQKLESVEAAVGGAGRAVVTVTNTGSVAGKSVVQLYAQAPYTAGGLEKAAVQLVDFEKTNIIQPGESQQVTIEFDPKYIASYDESAVKVNGTQGAWVLEAGDYYFAIGNGAHEALNNILALKRGSADGLLTITRDERVNADNAMLWTLDATDIETYSINVENALQDANLNYFIENAVEYTTRSDWSKGWNEITGISPTEEMMVGLTNNTYSLGANGGQVVWGADNGLKMIDFVVTDEEGNYAGVLDFSDARWDQLVDQITLDEAISFVEQADADFENIDSIGYPRTPAKDGPIGFVFDQVPGYAANWNSSNAKEPTYVSGKGEYDNYSMATMPTAPVVACTWNKELVEREGELLGEQSLWSNMPGILAPGLNLHRSTYCARNHEYYSEDAMLSNLLGIAVCRGGKSKGLMMEPKHLAFNHQETNRAGISTFFTEQAGRENELRAFQGCLSSNDAMGIMTTFNRIGTVFGGADEGMLVQIVRNEWGYTGWIVTDMVNGADYMNWKDSLFGGGSAMLAINTTYNETEWGSMTSNKKLIASDESFQQHMKLGLKYCIYTTAQSNAMNGITSNTSTVYVRTWWQNVILGTEVGFGALTVGFAVLAVMAGRKKKA